MGRWRPIAVVAAATLAFAACSSSPAPVVKLDGSPRVPTVEGVVQRASATAITLDGNRKYSVTSKLVSFSTYNRKAVALKSTVGKYVQLGLDEREAKWLGLIGIVSDDGQGHQTVIYQGDLVKVDGSKFIFKDGTVLVLAKGLTPPDDPLGPTLAVLDAKRHVIQGATFQSEATTTTRPKSK